MQDVFAQVPVAVLLALLALFTGDIGVFDCLDIETGYLDNYPGYRQNGCAYLRGLSPHSGVT
ncbi:hypothetical protein [Desulfotruncus arcticus]|uniref:hypothetical protein n=1 Tax=Desulfotruncus arcticus TaxID=341036 RepID=UPI001EE494D7|nr:hypothetical protein [Desulfotruncus arcticus]